MEKMFGGIKGKSCDSAAKYKCRLNQAHESMVGG